MDLRKLISEEIDHLNEALAALEGKRPPKLANKPSAKPAAPKRVPGAKPTNGRRRPGRPLKSSGPSVPERILEVMNSTPGKGHSASEFAAVLGIPTRTVTGALSAMKSAERVVLTKDGWMATPPTESS